jgi:hypothetical protein
MSDPIHTGDLPNWPSFYRKLCRVGPAALTGLPREWVSKLQAYASTSDMFWSDSLQPVLYEYWDHPPAAVERVMQEFAENVRQAFREPPLCWEADSWLTSSIAGEPMPIEDCIEQVDFKLTARLRKALVRAAESRFEPTAGQRGPLEEGETAMPRHATTVSLHPSQPWLPPKVVKLKPEDSLVLFEKLPP